MPENPERGCCRCGATTNGDGSLVTWVCQGCGRLVCRECALTVPGSVPLVYYDDTLCSPACHIKLGSPTE